MNVVVMRKIHFNIQQDKISERGHFMPEGGELYCYISQEQSQTFHFLLHLLDDVNLCCPRWE